MQTSYINASPHWPDHQWQPVHLTASCLFMAPFQSGHVLAILVANVPQNVAMVTRCHCLDERPKAASPSPLPTCRSSVLPKPLTTSLQTRSRSSFEGSYCFMREGERPFCLLPYDEGRLACLLTSRRPPKLKASHQQIPLF